MNILAFVNLFRFPKKCAEARFDCNLQNLVCIRKTAVFLNSVLLIFPAGTSHFSSFQDVRDTLQIMSTSMEVFSCKSVGNILCDIVIHDVEFHTEMNESVMEASIFILRMGL